VRGASHRLLRACVAGWRIVSDERTASLFLAEQSLQPPAWRALQRHFRAWREGAGRIQVWMAMSKEGFGGCLV